MSAFESFGKYALLEKLATGGMAEVFLARGNGAGGIGKFFAIKRILPQYADSPEFIDMFKDEAKIAINLNHNNIVSIHEFGVEKGQFFLVMDYVEGRNLRQILNKMKKSGLQFSIDQIVYCIKEVAAGLDHAHRCIDGSTGKPLNITHRDMSPQNLMVSFEGEVKIVDFGIAKAESQIETTRAGTLKGKFGYMSPEQAEGQPVDLRTDIFSLAIVMWELLANDRLFVANNEINTLRKIRDCQIPSLRKINPNIHSELERIVQKGLARDRNLRYQTGAALHRDLNRFLNRQYPDFSPQDFAVFIKSVFADEILALRKRLVEYSKVNLSVNLDIPEHKSFEDNEATSLLDTNTNSLVGPQSGADEAQSLFNTINKVDSAVTHTPVPGNANTRTSAQPHLGSTSTNASEASIELSPGTGTDAAPNFNTSTATVAQPATSAGVTQTSAAPLLDEKALIAMERDVITRPVRLESSESTSPSISTRSNNQRARNQHRKRSRASQKAKPVRFATFVVFALMCVSIYAYLAKYFTPMMSDVIAVTDPYIHDFHTALGVEPGTKNISSTARQPMATSSPTATPTTPVSPSATPPPATTSTATAQQQHAIEEELGPPALVVISNPSGAEILINEKATGMITPSRVEVPKGPFSITIRKRGYVDYKKREATAQETFGHRLTANLIKMNVAYVDIEVFPPQEATIFINGKPLGTQRGMIRELPIPANTLVRVRAENKAGSAYDETTINLPVDKRLSIQLNPRKAMRLPSNTPNE